MNHNFKKYWFALYWTVGLLLIVWIEFWARSGKAEEALLPSWILIFQNFPSSFLVNYLSSFLSKDLHIGDSNGLIGLTIGLVTLTVGFFQWFYFVPWIFRKIRKK